MNFCKPFALVLLLATYTTCMAQQIKTTTTANKIMYNQEFLFSNDKVLQFYQNNLPQGWEVNIDGSYLVFSAKEKVPVFHGNMDLSSLISHIKYGIQFYFETRNDIEKFSNNKIYTQYIVLQKQSLLAARLSEYKEPVNKTYETELEQIYDMVLQQPFTYKENAIFSSVNSLVAFDGIIMSEKINTKPHYFLQSEIKKYDFVKIRLTGSTSFSSYSFEKLLGKNCIVKGIVKGNDKKDEMVKINLLPVHIAEKNPAPSIHNDAILNYYYKYLPKGWQMDWDEKEMVLTISKNIMSTGDTLLAHAIDGTPKTIVIAGAAEPLFFRLQKGDKKTATYLKQDDIVTEHFILHTLKKPVLNAASIANSSQFLSNDIETIYSLLFHQNFPLIDNHIEKYLGKPFTINGTMEMYKKNNSWIFYPESSDLGDVILMTQMPVYFNDKLPLSPLTFTTIHGILQPMNEGPVKLNMEKKYKFLLTKIITK